MEITVIVMAIFLQIFDYSGENYLLKLAKLY